MGPRFGGVAGGISARINKDRAHGKSYLLQQHRHSQKHLSDDSNDRPVVIKDYICIPILCCLSRHQLDKINVYRQVVGNVLNHKHFAIFIIILIIINAILIGISTFDFVTENKEVQSAFDNVDLAFLCLFTVELGLHFFVNGLRLFKHRWLIFDFVIIISSWCLADHQFNQAFRILRALRLVTRIRTMRLLVDSIVKTAPKMVAIIFMLLLMFFIFSVMFTESFGDLGDCDDSEENYFGNYFGRIDYTAFTLFQFMTIDDWPDIGRCVMQYYWFAWIPIVFFIIITAFIVINLVIAVFCEAMVEYNNKIRTKPASKPEKLIHEDLNDSEFNDQGRNKAHENITYPKQQISLALTIISAIILVCLILAIICDHIILLRKKDRRRSLLMSSNQSTEEMSRETSDFSNNYDSKEESSTEKCEIRRLEGQVNDLLKQQELLLNTVQNLKKNLKEQNAPKKLYYPSNKNEIPVIFHHDDLVEVGFRKEERYL